MTSYTILRRVEDFDYSVKESFQNVLEYQEQVSTIFTTSSQRRRRQLLPESTTQQDIETRIEECGEQPDLTESVANVVSHAMVASPGSRDPASSIPAADTRTTHFVISAMTPRSCNLDCACACHHTRHLRTPQFLNRLVGSLFIGYRMSPILQSPCIDLNCQTNTTRITYTYAFPHWFWKNILCTSISFDRARGPELNLRVMKMRPSFAPAFSTIIRDESEVALANIKQLIEDKETSVLDVDEDSNSLLWVSEYRRFRSNVTGNTVRLIL